MTGADRQTELDRAKSLAFRGDRTEALEVVGRVLAAEPDRIDALVLQATLLLEQREGDEALAVWQRAASLAPRSAEVLNGLARCRHALGDDEGGLAAAEEARAVLGEGDNFRHRGAVYLTMVWCLRELRRYKEALEVAEEGLSGMPDAVLAQWAAVVEEEWAESQKEEC